MQYRALSFIVYRQYPTRKGGVLSKILMLMAALAVAGCASAPLPPTPNENKRVPVNRTLPSELQKVNR